jgi:hypothetical protein
MVYDEAGAVGQVRKLRQSWFGPYRVAKRLSDVSYILCAGRDERIALVHVKQIRGLTSGAEEKVREPDAGLWPNLNPGATREEGRTRVHDPARGKAQVRLGMSAYGRQTYQRLLSWRASC